MGKLILVRGPSPDPEIPHRFARVSVVALADRRLSAGACRVLGAIERHCWGDSRECWVSNATLGEHSGGVKPEAVRRSLRELERLGYLRVVPDSSKVRGHRLVLLYPLKRPGPPD